MTGTTAWLRIACTCLLLGVILGPRPLQAQPMLSLDERMHGFLAALDTAGMDVVAEYFPVEGMFVYRHTVHGLGPDLSREWRFPAHEIRAAIEGPLWSVFNIQWEGQPVGYLAHQVLERPGKWRRVGTTRYVPPGSDSTSRTYVEWRREGARWVIAEIADEYFPSTVPLPDWCC